VVITNLSLNLTESASRYPDAAALRCADVTTTYSMLADDVARFADYLIDGGLEPGDRVGVMLPNGAAFAVVFYGVLRAGGVVVPMSPSLRFRAVEFDSTVTDERILFHAGRRAMATELAAVTAGTQPVRVGKHGIATLTAGFAGRTRPVDRAEDDIAVTLYDFGTTGVPDSGTTGVPKVTQLTHGDLASNGSVIARRVLDLGSDDIVMGCLPLFDASGLSYGLLAAVSAGATLVLLPRFDSRRALEVIAAERVTVFEGVPAMYRSMLAAADRCQLDFSSLRVCMSIGASMPEDVLSRFEDRFGCMVVQATESAFNDAWLVTGAIGGEET
jgi:long-chain acyl-CoA synthetase